MRTDIQTQVRLDLFVEYIIPSFPIYISSIEENLVFAKKDATI